MPNLTSISKAYQGAESAARQATSFGSTGNPSVKGALRKFIRRTKHTLSDANPDSSYRSTQRQKAENLRNKSRELQRGFNNGFPSGPETLQNYKRDAQAIENALKATSGGERAVNAFDSYYVGDGVKRTLDRLHNSSPFDADAMRSALRQSESGKDAAETFLRMEQPRFQSAAAKTYQDNLASIRALRHANIRTQLHNDSVNRLMRGTNAADKYVPHAVTTALLGSGAYQDINNRRHHARGEVSPGQKRKVNSIFQEDTFSRKMKVPSKDRIKSLRQGYEDAKSLPGDYVTLNHAAALSGATAGVLGGNKFLKGAPPMTRLLAIVAGASGGRALGETANRHLNSATRDNLHQQTEGETLKPLKERLDKLYKGDFNA